MWQTTHIILGPCWNFSNHSSPILFKIKSLDRTQYWKPMFEPPYRIYDLIVAMHYIEACIDLCNISHDNVTSVGKCS